MEFLQDMAKSTGRVPPALQNRTLVERGNAFFWEAFQLLSKTRRSLDLGGVADISLPDILAYADLARIYDRDIRLQLARVVVALDDAFQGWLAAKQQKPEGKD